MVARHHAPRDAEGPPGRHRVFECFERGVCHAPLLRVVAVVDDITHVADKGDVEGVAVGDNPLGLCGKGRRPPAAEVFRIELCVRQGHQREVRPWQRRRRLAAVERHRVRRRQRRGEAHAQRCRGAGHVGFSGGGGGGDPA